MYSKVLRMADTVMSTAFRGIEGLQEFLIFVGKPELAKCCLGNRPHSAGLGISLILAVVHILVSTNDSHEM